MKKFYSVLLITAVSKALNLDLGDSVKKLAQQKITSLDADAELFYGARY
jgi:hypothetical protein